jgi:hypothetical protein
MGERRVEGVVIGPGQPGHLRILLGSGDDERTVETESERIPPALRMPNSKFVAVVNGTRVVRVEPLGSQWFELEGRIREVLNTEWDPIGVSDFVADEYDGYIGGIMSMLRAGASQGAIAEHLLRIEVDAMGLETTAPHHVQSLLDVAARLCALKV